MADGSRHCAGPVCVILCLLSLRTLHAELCKEVRLIGGDLSHNLTHYHNQETRIFLDPRYTIPSDGQIIGWKFLNRVNGSTFFLDVWQPDASVPLKFYLAEKRPASNIQIGNISIYYKVPVTVRKGWFMGIHTKNTTNGGVATGIHPGMTRTNLKYAGNINDYDATIVNAGNTYTASKIHYNGRMYALVMMLLIDRRTTDPDCYQRFTKNPRLDLTKATKLSMESNVNSDFNCARKCKPHPTCMTFQYNASTKECTLYTYVIDLVANESPDEVYGF